MDMLCSGWVGGCVGGSGLRFIDPASGFKPIIGRCRRCKGLHLAQTHLLEKTQVSNRSDWRFKHTHTHIHKLSQQKAPSSTHMFIMSKNTHVKLKIKTQTHSNTHKAKI